MPEEVVGRLYVIIDSGRFYYYIARDIPDELKNCPRDNWGRYLCPGFPYHRLRRQGVFLGDLLPTRSGSCIKIVLGGDSCDTGGRT